MTIHASDVRPVYAIVGRDPFLCGEALAELLRRLQPHGDDLGPTRFDASQAELADVLDEVRTVSLLGNRRVVIVEEADAFITAHRVSLERYASAPTEGGVLILMAQTLPKTTRLCRIIEQNGAVVRCEPPRPWEITTWATRRAQERYGKRLAQAAAKKLRDHVGDALGVIDAELSKLSTYVGERAEIAPADVDAMTGQLREEKVFAVIDAMAAHDPSTALQCWEQVLATDRAAPGRAIAGLAWAVRQLLQARRDWESGVPIRALAPRMFTDPATFQRRLEGVTTAQLEAQQRDLLAADIAVKTGASTVDCAVEKFIVTHSVAGQGTRQVSRGRHS